MRKVNILLALVMMFSVCACNGSAARISHNEFNQNFETFIPDSFVAAENENFFLEWNSETGRIIMTDKKNGIPWSYVPFELQQTRFDDDGYEITNNPQVESAIIVSYVDPENNLDDSVNSYTGAVKKKNIYVSQIFNGISITYYFEKEEISVTVDFILRNNSLEVTIDPKKISEGNVTVVSISLAPFFCSVQNETNDTYLFMPSGSGALIYADKSSEDVTVVSEEVYGTDARRPEDDVIKTFTQSVRMPVYGAKNGDRAICAIIEKGAESAIINANVGNSVIGYSAVYATFDVRSHELMLTNTSSSQRTKYSDEMTENIFSIGFYPLYGDDADYIGMANCYRGFLKDTYELSSTENECSVNLKIIGGTEYLKSVLGIPYNSVYVTTTVEQAQNIVKDIFEGIGSNISVQLYGFGRSGIDVGSLSDNLVLCKKMGSENQLIALSNYCKSNGISLYLDYDLLRINSSSKAASFRSDSAITTNGRRVTLYNYHIYSGARDTTGRGWNNSSSFTLLKRSLIPEAVAKMLDSTKKYKLSGVSISTLSYIAYSDHSQREYYSKGLMASQVATEIDRIRNDGLSVLSVSANDYAAASSNRIYEVPFSSSGYDVYDTDVPFYEIVFKGYVPMSSPIIGTQANNQKSILKAIESGCGITYALAYNYSNELINTPSLIFYGSNYRLNKNNIIDFAKKYEDYYAAVLNATITDHIVITDTLRKTVFSNGIVVYVNYDYSAVQTEDGIVEGMSYLIVYGGE